MHARMDAFEAFVRANRAMLQQRHRERPPEELGAPPAELLMNTLRQQSEQDRTWYHFLKRLRGQSGWPADRTVQIWEALCEGASSSSADMVTVSGCGLSLSVASY